MSTHNIDFYEDLTKFIFELSSNTHLISSAEKYFQSSRKTITCTYTFVQVNLQIPNFKMCLKFATSNWNSMLCFWLKIVSLAI